MNLVPLLCCSTAFNTGRVVIDKGNAAIGRYGNSHNLAFRLYRKKDLNNAITSGSVSRVNVLITSVQSGLACWCCCLIRLIIPAWLAFAGRCRRCSLGTGVGRLGVTEQQKKLGAEVLVAALVVAAAATGLGFDLVVGRWECPEWESKRTSTTTATS
jgi:hypothetical protein